MKLIVFHIFTLFVLSCSTTKQESIVELDSNWEFKSENDKEYLPASVPGTVHLVYYKTERLMIRFLD